VAGDRQRAQRLLEQILQACPPGDERVPALRLLAEVRYNDDSFPEAWRLLRQALSEVGDDPAERAAIHFNLGYVGHATERLAEGAEHMHAALPLAEARGDEGLLAEVLASVTIVDFLAGRGLDEQRLHRALAKEDVTRRTPTPSRPSTIRGAAMSWMGRPTEALASLEGLRTRLVEHGDEAALPFLAFLLSPAACARGDTSTNFRQPAAHTVAARRIWASSQSLFTIRASSSNAVADTTSAAGTTVVTASAKAWGSNSRCAMPTRAGVKSRSRSTSATPVKSSRATSVTQPRCEITPRSAGRVEKATGSRVAGSSTNAAQPFTRASDR
jgi:hypothetical protein